MTDDQQVRSLLALAAELPDDVQPSVASLLHRARRMRRARAAGSVLAAVIVTAAAFSLPAVIRGQSRSAPLPIGTGSHAKPGPTAAQLAHFRWSTLRRSPLGPEPNPLLAWTGHELIEIALPTTKSAPVATAYVPATRAWHRIASPPNTLGLNGAVTVWTRHELFVTNGRIFSWSPAVSDFAVAGLYNPATNTWSLTALPRQMLGATNLAAVWTGRDIVVAGANYRRGTLAVAAFDPRTGRWRVITPSLPGSHPPVGVAMVATPGRVLLWSLWSKTTQTSKNSYAVASGVDVLALKSDGWHTVTGTWPQHKVVENPAYANETIFIPPGQIWCGLCSHPPGDFPAQLADASTLALQAIPAGPLVRHPLDEPPIWLWNGSFALAANEQASPYKKGVATRAWITHIAAFDPASKRWTTLPVPAGHPPTAGNPIWAGRQLLLLTAAGKLLSFHG